MRVLIAGMLTFALAVNTASAQTSGGQIQVGDLFPKIAPILNSLPNSGAVQVPQQFPVQVPELVPQNPPNYQDPAFTNSNPQYVNPPAQYVNPPAQYVPPATQLPGSSFPTQRPLQSYPNQPQAQTYIAPSPTGELTADHLRTIDGLVVQLTGYCRELHDEFHEHLEGERHAEKLDEEVTALEHMSEDLHEFVKTADGSPQSVARLRADTNEFIQMSIRIARTIDLTAPWLRGNESPLGIRHMREVSREVIDAALQIDRYLPVDEQVIDGQAKRLEAAVKELHDEFHEHLENYQVSRHLDEDLESVETLVEDMHAIAEGRSWNQIDFNRLLIGLDQVKQKTGHIESLFVRQAEIGVRTSDWIGIEHSRDAITDVLSSAYLLEHMIRKSNPSRPIIDPSGSVPNDNRPLRDRHGHEIRRPNR